MKKKTVDVIIPVFKPDHVLRETLLRLDRQSCSAGHILIINVNEAYWREEYLEACGRAEVFHVPEEEYDRGTVRDLGAGFSDADILVFLDPHAVPETDGLLAALTRAFDRPEIRAVSAKEHLNAGKDVIRSCEQNVRFPNHAYVRTFQDARQIGTEAFRMSGQCAAYDHETYNQLGGFTRPCIAAEDELYAGRLLRLGYAVAYTPSAGVRIPMEVSEGEEMRRTFDRGVSISLHPEIYRDFSPLRDKSRYEQKVAARLRRSGFGYLLPLYKARCLRSSRALKKGMQFRTETLETIRRSTANPWFWNYSGQDSL